MTQYNRLIAALVSRLDGDILSPSGFDQIERNEERAAIEVCRVTGLTRTEWASLTPVQREPWLERTLAPAKNDDERPEQPTNKAKGINGRMLAKMASDPTCHGWTCTQWAHFLKCTSPAVTGTLAWKRLAEARQSMKAQKALDRHRRTGNRKRS